MNPGFTVRIKGLSAKESDTLLDFLYALFGICADLLVRTLEKRAMPWRRHLAVR